MHPQKNGFQADINGIRGLSVLVVVLYHFNLRVMGGGFIGVDAFFVISGYLMTKIIVGALLRGEFSYAGFILRRAARIVPGLFCVVAALLGLGYWLLPPSDMQSLAQQALHAVYFNANNYYAAKQGYFSGGADDNWLLHTWSLAVEWQFYMLYPPLVWGCLTLARKLRPAAPLPALTLLLAMVAAASLGYCVASSSQLAFFSVAARSWQMIAGGLVYLHLMQRAAAPRLGPLMSYGGCALMLLCMVLIKRYALESVWPGYYAALPVLGTCLILLASYQRNLLLNNVVVQKLGAWSYSIYLWHMPVVIGLTVTAMLETHARLAQLGGIGLSVLLGYLSFRYIEPARYLRNASTGRALTGLVAGGAALAAVALLAIRSDGFMWRVDDARFYRNLQASQAAETYDPECENRGRSADHFCVLNKDAPGKRILVMGDSHAGHLYAWFRAHAGKVNTTFFVKSGCPVIEGYERVGVDANCREFSRRAYLQAASGLYDTVIISQHWSYFSPNAQGICAPRGGRCVPVSQLDNPAEVQDSLKRSLRKILDHKVQLAVLDGTPFFPTSAPKQVERDFYWYGRLPASVDSTAFFQQNLEFDRLFRDLAPDPGFTLLSLRGALCDGQRCSLYDRQAGLPIYRDRDHFNPAWIARNGDIFQPLINRVAGL